MKQWFVWLYILVYFGCYKKYSRPDSLQRNWHLFLTVLEAEVHDQDTSRLQCLVRTRLLAHRAIFSLCPHVVQGVSEFSHDLFTSPRSHPLHHIIMMGVWILKRFKRSVCGTVHQAWQTVSLERQETKELSLTVAPAYGLKRVSLQREEEPKGSLANPLPWGIRAGCPGPKAPIVLKTKC